MKLSNMRLRLKDRIKKTAACLLAAAMVFTAVPMSFAETEGAVGAQSGTLSDISGHWAEAAIKEAAELKIVGGYPDGTYQPDTMIKREEFFTLITKILTETPDTSEAAIKFKDVVSYEWYVPTIKIAVAAGITSGYEDGTFGIGKTITRQEAAKVAASIIPTYDAPTGAGVSAALDKKEIGDWAYKSVDLMYRKGYMAGDDKGNFAPNRGLTRAEAAKILLEIKKNESVIAADADNVVKKQLLTGCAASHLSLKPGDSLENVTFEQLSKLPTGVFKGGSGSMTDPYQISTQDQLNHMHQHMEAGAYFKLVSDLTVSKDYATVVPDFKDEVADWSLGTWHPIGDKTTPFKGVFDGDGHTISGLNINSKGVNANATGSAVNKSNKNLKSAPSGFVGYLASQGAIINLIIDDTEINNTGNYSGAIAGYAEGSVTNCTTENTTEINGAQYTGGIVGYGSGLLSKNINKAEVTGTAKYTGGIAGYYESLDRNLTECTNRGTIKGKESVGGVVGYTLTSGYNLSGDSITKCVNYGKVTSGAYHGGGIVGIADGKTNGVTVSNCVNYGNIKSDGIGGGIVGYSMETKVTVLSSHNEGSVEGNGAGGIVGNNEGSINKCFNTGQITGNSDVGGIAGFQLDEKARVNNSYNEGNVEDSGSGSNVGGIVGQSSAQIYNVYNTGKISGTNAAGGIVGKNTGRTGNAYNTGKVSGTNDIGGIIGRNTGYLENGFWLEDSSKDGVGGSQNLFGITRSYSIKEEQLKGEETLRTDAGQEKLLDVLNVYNGKDAEKLWTYTKGYEYPQLISLSK